MTRTGRRSSSWSGSSPSRRRSKCPPALLPPCCLPVAHAHPPALDLGNSTSKGPEAGAHGWLGTEPAAQASLSSVALCSDPQRPKGTLD